MNDLCERICEAIKAADLAWPDDPFHTVDADDCIKIVREQFAAIPAPDPARAAYKLVPINPGIGMLQAALESSRYTGSKYDAGATNALPVCYELAAAEQIYRAMLAAAPAIPAPEGGYAEPVAWRWRPSAVFGEYIFCGDKDRAELAREHGMSVEPLYRAALAAPAPPAPAWQPIETAPKDGTAILLGSRGGAWVGKWLPVYVSGYRPDNPWSSLMLNHDHMGEKRCKPTHWMPLPAAPQTKEPTNDR